jgi:hypothetical protein
MLRRAQAMRRRYTRLLETEEKVSKSFKTRILTSKSFR